MASRLRARHASSVSASNARSVLRGRARSDEASSGERFTLWATIRRQAEMAVTTAGSLPLLASMVPRSGGFTRR